MSKYPTPPEDQLRVCNIFNSIEGETTLGGPLCGTTFLRLHGCNLRCWRRYLKEGGLDPQYQGCDAPHSVVNLLDLHEMLGIQEIINRLLEQHVLDTHRITITGGEPLLQWETLRLMLPEIRRELESHIGWPASKRLTIAVETNGSFPIDRPSDDVDCYVMDWKLPDSGETDKMLEDNLFKLNRKDVLKLVVNGKRDLDYIEQVFIPKLQQLTGNANSTPFRVALGRRLNDDNVGDSYSSALYLLSFLREKRLHSWILNLQMHKLLWPQKLDRDDLIAVKQKEV